MSDAWKNEIDFLIKRYPPVERYRQELTELISENMGTAILKYAPRIETARKFRKKEYDKKRKQLKKNGEDIQINEKMPDKKQGNQEKGISRLVAQSLKGFWIDVMGHKNFYYDIKKRNTDDATEFVNFFVEAVFGAEDRAIIAVSSFRAISDKLKVKKKGDK